MEENYFTGSMPLLTPNSSFMKCGGPEAFTSSTIFSTCGKESALEGRNATNLGSIFIEKFLCAFPSRLCLFSICVDRSNVSHGIMNILCGKLFPSK